MARLPAWLPELLKRINWGCSTSPLVLNLSDDRLCLNIGRDICLELWPFIEALPENISNVRDSLPGHMTAAINLLTELADDERHYQRLFLSQCELAGLSQTELLSHRHSSPSKRLCEVMSRYSRQRSFIDGIFAIVTAELAATAFSRNALPHYEQFFSARIDTFGRQKVEDGLGWLKLHCTPHTRNALWLSRMLGDLGVESTKQPPPPVTEVLEAVLALWRCPVLPLQDSVSRIGNEVSA